MKKILLTIAIVFVIIPSFAQDLKYIKLTEERWEFMTREEKLGSKEGGTVNVSYQVYNDIKEPNPDAKLRFFLILSYETSNQYERIPLNGKLLIRSGKDEVFTFVNEVEDGLILAYSPKTGYPEFIGCHVSVSGTYINRGKYELSMDEVSKLGKDGVVKIRIETNGESIDINLPAKERIKIDKERKDVNKFAYFTTMTLRLTDCVFNPTKDF